MGKKSVMRSGSPLEPGAYPTPYLTAREDLAKIIAQETCGMVGALPDPDDYDLADQFIKTISSQ